MPQPTNADGVGREGNAILAAIPHREYAQMRDRLEPVELGIKDAIYQPDEPMRHVYFPITAVLSMVAHLDGEVAVEVATIGREGMAGLPVFLGVPVSPNTVFAQIPGMALRMRADHLHEVLTGDGALHGQLHRYIQATMVLLPRTSPATGCTASRSALPAGCS